MDFSIDLCAIEVLSSRELLPNLHFSNFVLALNDIPVKGPGGEMIRRGL